MKKILLKALLYLGVSGIAILLQFVFHLIFEIDNSRLIHGFIAYIFVCALLDITRYFCMKITNKKLPS